MFGKGGKRAPEALLLSFPIMHRHEQTTGIFRALQDLQQRETKRNVRFFTAGEFLTVHLAPQPVQFTNASNLIWQDFKALLADSVRLRKKLPP